MWLEPILPPVKTWPTPLGRYGAQEANSTVMYD